jgi:hypothetical protein
VARQCEAVEGIPFFPGFGSYIWQDIGPLQDFYLTQDNTNTENRQTHIHAQARIRTHDSSEWATKDNAWSVRVATVTQTTAYVRIKGMEEQDIGYSTFPFRSEPFMLQTRNGCPWLLFVRSGKEYDKIPAAPKITTLLHHLAAFLCFRTWRLIKFFWRAIRFLSVMKHSHSLSQFQPSSLSVSCLRCQNVPKIFHKHQTPKIPRTNTITDTVFLSRWSYHGPNSTPGQVMWDLWCTKWQCGRLSQSIWFSLPIYILPPTSCT